MLVLGIPLGTDLFCQGSDLSEDGKTAKFVYGDGLNSFTRTSKIQIARKDTEEWWSVEVESSGEQSDAVLKVTES
jgi:hypothetical protein